MIGKTTGMGKTIYTFGNAYHCPVAMPDNVAAVFSEDVIGNLLASEPHVFIVAFQVAAKVEVFNIGCTEILVFRDNSVEEKFEGLHVGGEGRTVTVIVRDVADISAADAAM